MTINPFENLEEILYELLPAGSATIAYSSYMLALIVSLAVKVLIVLACWKVFSKAGQPGWATLIPIYRDIVLYRITWGSGVFLLLSLIPCAGWIISLITSHKLSKAFGHGFGFTLGLWFFPGIFYLILGLGRSEYHGAK